MCREDERQRLLGVIAEGCTPLQVRRLRVISEKVGPADVCHSLQQQLLDRHEAEHPMLVLEQLQGRPSFDRLRTLLI